MSKTKTTVIANPWQSLRRFTAARIALGRAGVSQPTEPHLDFELAHARARDAVHLTLDAKALAQSLSMSLAQQGVQGVSCIALCSAAENRNIYLQRPDLGRRLDAASRQALKALREEDRGDARPYDLAFVIADGLSALAIEQNAMPFLQAVMWRLKSENWSLAPIGIVSQGRVAIGDEVGQLLDAKAVVVLIGERPGLSSPDSMGLYLTWEPRVGLTDESRNCISNVRPAGLRHEDAAFKLHYLLSESRKRQLSGVGLKDDTATGNAQLNTPRRNFLLENR
jgi:ethanolamine ammonia-lyase small subunit